MSESNPFSAPEAQTGNASLAGDVNIEQVASGQKMVIYAIAIYFIAVAARRSSPELSLLLLLVAFALSLFGSVRLATSVCKSLLGKIFSIVCMFVPLLNILILLRLNGQAITLLKEAGYKVGLMGASRPKGSTFQEIGNDEDDEDDEDDGDEEEYDHT